MLTQKKIISYCRHEVVEPHIIDEKGDIWVTHATINLALSRSKNWTWTVAQRRAAKGKPMPFKKVQDENGKRITLFRFRDFECLVNK